MYSHKFSNIIFRQVFWIDNAKTKSNKSLIWQCITSVPSTIVPGRVMENTTFVPVLPHDLKSESLKTCRISHQKSAYSKFRHFQW